MGTDPICVHYSALSSVKWRCSVSATTLYVNYYINYGSQCMLFQVVIRDNGKPTLLRPWHVQLCGLQRAGRAREKTTHAL